MFCYTYYIYTRSSRITLITLIIIVIRIGSPSMDFPCVTLVSTMNSMSTGWLWRRPILWKKSTWTRSGLMILISLLTPSIQLTTALYFSRPQNVFLPNLSYAGITQWCTRWRPVLFAFAQVSILQADHLQLPEKQEHLKTPPFRKRDRNMNVH